MGTQQYEEKLSDSLNAAGIPHIREYKFHPTRKWRFDIAIPSIMLGIEIQGGVYIQGRHSRGFGITKDCEKILNAFLLGWSVIPIVPSQISSIVTMLLEYKEWG